MFDMATATSAAAAASVLALLGAKKVYSEITAHRGTVLPSLRAANLLKCAYPEDYYPGMLACYCSQLPPSSRSDSAVYNTNGRSRSD
jgi:hypothetical protein